MKVTYAALLITSGLFICGCQRQPMPQVTSDPVKNPTGFYNSDTNTVQTNPDINSNQRPAATGSSLSQFNGSGSANSNTLNNNLNRAPASLPDTNPSLPDTDPRLPDTNNR